MFFMDAMSTSVGNKLIDMINYTTHLQVEWISLIVTEVEQWSAGLFLSHRKPCQINLLISFLQLLADYFMRQE